MLHSLPSSSRVIFILLTVCARTLYKALAPHDWMRGRGLHEDVEKIKAVILRLQSDKGINSMMHASVLDTPRNSMRLV